MSLRQVLLAAGCACAMGAAAFPSVSGVTAETDLTARRVTVRYTLTDGPAIITIDLLTNGVSIGEAACAPMFGDVNVKLDDGGHSACLLMDHGAWPVHVAETPITAKVTAWAPDMPPDYMVVGLETPKDVRYFTSTNALPGGLANDEYRTKFLVMRRIPAAGARRRLGCQTGENGVNYDDVGGKGSTQVRETTRIVSFTNDFWMGIYPVTQKQWTRLIWEVNPSTFKSGPEQPCRPVEGVTYKNVRSEMWPDRGHDNDLDGSHFMGRIRKRTGVEFDLPTDAQWEFACRAGCDAAFYNGSGNGFTATFDPELDKLGWFDKNSGNTTHAVGQKQPNAWGLYDMLGNVWELVLDFVPNDIAISNAETVEPTGLTLAQTGSPSNRDEAYRANRGGAYYSKARQCRCAFRGGEPQRFTNDGTGFRLIAPIGLKW